MRVLVARPETWEAIERGLQAATDLYYRQDGAEFEKYKKAVIKLIDTLMDNTLTTAASKGPSGYPDYQDQITRLLTTFEEFDDLDLQSQLDLLLQKAREIAANNDTNLRGLFETVLSDDSLAQSILDSPDDSLAQSILDSLLPGDLLTHIPLDDLDDIVGPGEE